MFYSFLPLLHVNTQSAIRSELVLADAPGPVYLGSQWDAVMLYSTPQLNVPSSLPSLDPSLPPGSGSDAVQRLFTSSGPRLRPRRQWLSVSPIMLLTQPPAPAQYHIRDDGMTKWLLSAPVTAPQPCIPRLKLIKMARFVSVIANSSVCLHNLFQTRAHKNNVELIPEKLLLSLTHQNCKKCLSKFFSSILSKLDETWEWHWEISDIF